MRFSTHALLFVLGLSLALLSCAQPPSEESVRQAISDVRTKYMEAYNRGDAASVVAFFTEDAKLLPPDTTMVSGKQGIQAFYAPVGAGVSSGLTLESMELQHGGDLAYDMGTYSVKIQPAGGQLMEEKGKYVAILRRQADGSWKLTTSIWNHNMPMP